MPSKNVIKEYLENSFYHLYNRGVNKLPIFYDPQDYKVFLSYLKDYLLPPIEKSYPSKTINNFSKDISLHAYCLMPNHFHLLVHQKDPQDINYFMRSFNTRYVRYINTKYNRIGTLYQGAYKAIRVTTDEQLLHLTRYIHQNPLTSITSRRNLEVMLKYPYSSIHNYQGSIHQAWVNPKPILDYFSQQNPSQQYLDFVSNMEPESQPLIDTTSYLHLD